MENKFWAALIKTHWNRLILELELIEELAYLTRKTWWIAMDSEGHIIHFTGTMPDDFLDKTLEDKAILITSREFKPEKLLTYALEYYEKEEEVKSDE